MPEADLSWCVPVMHFISLLGCQLRCAQDVTMPLCLYSYCIRACKMVLINCIKAAQSYTWPGDFVKKLGQCVQDATDMTVCINPAGMDTGQAMSAWSRHGQRTRFHAIPCPPGSMLLQIAWTHAVPPGGPPLAHGPMRAWPHVGPWPHDILPVGGCFHSRMCPCTHDMAWKPMYGSCGSMKA